MQLQQHIDCAVDSCRFFLDEAEQFHAVHTLDHAHMGHDGAHLVLLQVADKMPADVLGQLGSFGDQFLGTVLTE